MERRRKRERKDLTLEVLHFFFCGVQAAVFIEMAILSSLPRLPSCPQMVAATRAAVYPRAGPGECHPHLLNFAHADICIHVFSKALTLWPKCQ